MINCFLVLYIPRDCLYLNQIVMNKGFLLVSYFSLFIFIFGVFMKISHLENSNLLMGIGLISFLICVISLTHKKILKFLSK